METLDDFSIHPPPALRWLPVGSVPGRPAGGRYPEWRSSGTQVGSHISDKADLLDGRYVDGEEGADSIRTWVEETATTY